MTDKGNKILIATSIAVTVAMFVVMIVFNAIAALGTNDLFKNSVGNLSAKYTTEITPAGWTFTIWSFIYSWFIIWLVYAVVTLFLGGLDDGTKLYYQPPLTPAVVYFTFSANLLVNVSWLLLFDREYLIGALVALAILPVTAAIAIGISCASVNSYYGVLRDNGLLRHVWCVRLLLQNGVGCYAAWVTIATSLNLAIVLQYDAQLDPSDASTVALTCDIICIAGWFVLDVLCLDRWCRYLLTPYFVFVYALAGILDNNYTSGDRNSTITLVLEIVAAAALITKFFVMFYRHLIHPEYEESV